MFFTTNSTALARALDRSATRLFDDYNDAYAKNDPAIPVLLDPARFNHVVRDMIIRSRLDKKAAEPSRGLGIERTLEAATQAVLRLIARWDASHSAEAAAWELAVAVAAARLRAAGK